MDRDKHKNENPEWHVCYANNDDGAGAFNLTTHLKRKAEQKGSAKGNAWQSAASSKAKEKQPSHIRVTDPNEVFVSNLPFEATEQTIERNFSGCGSILKVKMLTWVSGKLKGKCNGRAFVKFDEQASTEPALKLDGSEFGGREIKVEYNPQEPGTAAAAKPQSYEEKLKVGTSSALMSGLKASKGLERAETKKKRKRDAPAAEPEEELGQPEVDDLLGCDDLF
eukprot:TRINITY_DN45400_c0_g1_i1.p1 TRINITY_DN45400_c0_g1~~TRINITY_DN45400_c0_g1_i1.p1  ORF type:complete len:223 (-),score=74.35 TRINITY_DN45400_c0_g1_i1:54-722(-)